MTDKTTIRHPLYADIEAAGPEPTTLQREAWGEDYLWMWCCGHPKEAAAEIDRLRTLRGLKEPTPVQNTATARDTIAHCLLMGNNLYETPEAFADAILKRLDHEGFKLTREFVASQFISLTSEIRP